MKIDYKKLLFSIGIAEGVGFLSSLLSGVFTGKQKEFIESLVQPPLSPPSWLFGVVWPILYAFMGAAAYLVYDSIKGEKFEKKKALYFYAAQLLVNFLWSIVFFRFESLVGGLVVLIILDILVAITMYKFRKINRLAFWLLIPYLAWILFATYLNIGFVVLN
ncbi:MAG: tryptophan-rich sensory protein [Clostridia bacterium]|nr:tryptophan-rich sensory protein [Clostridia bacterium]